jgi:peptidyl-prolyl cis-trans isomerase SurA
MNRIVLRASLALAALLHMGVSLAQIPPPAKAPDAKPIPAPAASEAKPIPVPAGADSAAVATSLPIDRIVAVVNEDVITQHELTRRRAHILRQLNKQGTPTPPEDVLTRQVLERMIVDLAQLQMAKETGIKVDDAQLDRTLSRIASDNKMDLTQFRAAVEKDGTDYRTFREDIRGEIIMSRLREREVDNAVAVSDSEVDAELSQEKSRQVTQTEYRLQHILLLIPDQATPQQIEAKRVKAEQAAAQLARGADFGQVAAGFSEAADALSGGNLGWRATSRLPSLFAEALAHMTPGQTSPVLKSANGFHIVKLLDTRGSSGTPQVTQTHARHILMKSKDGITDAELRQRLEALKTRIATGADFAELAKLQSEDVSASNGGDLGWISPGETVPEFERAVNELKPGQISDPIQTPFGWHLVQVLERREGALPDEKRKIAVRQAIRARKADEAYEDWLRQIRDKAYVENRLEEK